MSLIVQDTFDGGAGELLTGRPANTGQSWIDEPGFGGAPIFTNGAGEVYADAALVLGGVSVLAADPVKKVVLDVTNQTTLLLYLGWDTSEPGIDRYAIEYVITPTSYDLDANQFPSGGGAVSVGLGDAVPSPPPATPYELTAAYDEATRTATLAFNGTVVLSRVLPGSVTGDFGRRSLFALQTAGGMEMRLSQFRGFANHDDPVDGGGGGPVDASGWILC